MPAASQVPTVTFIVTGSHGIPLFCSGYSITGNFEAGLARVWRNFEKPVKGLCTAKTKPVFYKKSRSSEKRKAAAGIIVLGCGIAV